MIELETPEVRVTRQDCSGKHELSILKHVFVEWGSKADWDALCELHYKGHSRGGRQSLHARRAARAE